MIGFISRFKGCTQRRGQVDLAAQLQKLKEKHGEVTTLVPAAHTVSTNCCVCAAIQEKQVALQEMRDFKARVREKEVQYSQEHQTRVSSAFCATYRTITFVINTDRSDAKRCPTC
jgi:hypothetical protein